MKPGAGGSLPRGCQWGNHAGSVIHKSWKADLMTSALKLEDVPAAFIAAWNRHDTAALAGLFAGPAHFVNVNGTWWKNRGEIEAAHAQSHAGMFKDSQLDGDVRAITHLAPGVAALHVAWELTGLRNDDGTPAKARRGILLLVVTGDRDGWVIRAAQNTDIVPAAATPTTDRSRSVAPDGGDV